MHGSKQKRKRIRLQRLECNSVFDEDYRKRHEQTCHQGKRVRVAHKDDPANPFVAAKLSQSQKEHSDEFQDRDQKDTDSTAENAEKIGDNDELSSMNNSCPP